MTTSDLLLSLRCVYRQCQSRCAWSSSCRLDEGAALVAHQPRNRTVCRRPALLSGVFDPITRQCGRLIWLKNARRDCGDSH